MNKHSYMLEKSRELRTNSTEAEKILWRHVRRKKLGVKFYRQFIFEDLYIVDFYCFDKNLIIELDGGQHCENEQDTKRDEYLKQCGYKVLRFWNNEIFENINGCLETIVEHLK